MESNIMTAQNEQFAGECVKLLHSAPGAEEGLRRLLEHLGETLECERVYVFEEMDRQHIRNTYEWCGESIPSGIQQLPYVVKKDLSPWYQHLEKGDSIIEADVEVLRQKEPLLYEFLNSQKIHSVILCPLLSHGQMYGFLGADNPPPEKLTHISVLFDVLAYFVCSLVSQRELEKLREVWAAPIKQKAAIPKYAGKIVLLVDDSPQLLRLNERILRPQGYRILSAGTLREAGGLMEQHKPDVIVLDIDLTDGSGIDFCRELRRSGDVPVIFLTAHSDIRTAQESMKAGGCAFLTKPYRVEELQKAVIDAIERPVLCSKTAAGLEAWDETS